VSTHSRRRWSTSWRGESMMSRQCTVSVDIDRRCGLCVDTGHTLTFYDLLSLLHVTGFSWRSSSSQPLIFSFMVELWLLGLSLKEGYVRPYENLWAGHHFLYDSLNFASPTLCEVKLVIWGTYPRIFQVKSVRDSTRQQPFCFQLCHNVVVYLRK
jgi:hypothetical protein